MVTLAVVQGVTEFLPVSSSAHLIIVSEIFGGTRHAVSFDIMLHGATLGAVVVYFAKDIQRMARALVAKEDTEDRRISRALVLATMFIAIAGFFMYEIFSEIRSTSIVATALIVSGTLLIIADYSVQKGVTHPVPIWRRGIGVGLAQVCALIPGVSRSGITIAAGRALGFSRKEASRFSFILAIPVISGALVVLLGKVVSGSVSFDGVSAGTLTLGMGIAFVVGCLAIHLFLKIIERIGFFPFFLYQVAVGIVLVITK